ncbi:MAG: nitroreductase family protein [Acidobacteria bacterium]|nr:nitroreductase family protein [Acidobacteriota bacterium]
MSLLIVDQSKCEKDEFCVRECPAAVIRISAGDGFPELVEGGDAGCIRCGHCVAVCPHGAMSHADVPIESSPEIREALEIGEAQAAQFLRSRRSVRVFKDKPVEKEKIRRLIEIARYAPTGGNSQMIEWVAITDKSRLKKIAGLTVDWVRQLAKDPNVVAAAPYLPMVVAAWDAGFDSVLRNAPAVVVACAAGGIMTGQTDLTIAMTYLDLMAPALGLGTCWAGLLQGALAASPPLKAAAGIPEGHPYHYPMMLGYNDIKYFRLPERKAPKILYL